MIARWPAPALSREGGSWRVEHDSAQGPRWRIAESGLQTRMLVPWTLSQVACGGVMNGPHRGVTQVLYRFAR